jgi:selenium metabolism protein YedF
MKTIDARGKICPEPVILTKAQVDRGEEELEVLLDNPVPASNVRRFLENKGFAVRLKDDDGLLTVSAIKKKEGEALKTTESSKSPSASSDTISKPPTVKKTETQAAASPILATLPSANETFSILITCRTLGRSDEELGEVLMKSFLGTLSQMDNAPVVVALMNEGAKLALYDSSSCDHLKNLEKKGVTILVCGTCVNHFQIADQIGAGMISNMFEILEALNKASKIMTL